MKFTNKRKEEVFVVDAQDSRKYSVQPGDTFEVNEDNPRFESLAQAAFDAGLDTSDKLPTKSEEPAEQPAPDEEKKS